MSLKNFMVLALSASLVIGATLTGGCVRDEIATIEDIDKMCKLAFNWRMGPIELTDFGGLDSTLHILEYLREKTGDEKFTPPEILKKLVADGYKGKKARSKGGFYEYFVNKQN